MSFRSVTLCLAVLCVLSSSAAVWAGSDDAAGKFAEGNALLAKADFEGALAAYDAAAKADPENTEYRMKGMLVRRVMKMREALDKLDDEKWLQASTALYYFYQDNGVSSEALAMAEKIHAKQNNAESATMLARSQLAMGKHDEALASLSSLPKDKTCPETCVLTCLCLARQGKTAEAKAMCADIHEPEEPDGEFLYDLACLHAALGDSEDAMGTLKRCFECTSPGRLPLIKECAGRCGDFYKLRGNPAMADVMATESKIKSGCCGKAGASCSKSCTAEDGKACDKDKPACDKDKPKP